MTSDTSSLGDGERLTIQCGCGEKLTTLARNVGKRLKCPKCGQALLVLTPARSQAALSAPKIEDESQHTSNSSVFNLWSILGVFSFACALFLVWHSYSSHQARIVAANNRILQAADAAREWIAREKSLSNDEEGGVEQRLVNAVTDKYATDKSKGEELLNAVREVRKRKKAEMQAAALLRAAKEKLDGRLVNEAIALLQKHVADDAAVEKSAAQRLLAEAQNAASDTLALKSMLAMDDAAFDRVKMGGTIEDGLITYPALIAARKETFHRNLENAAHQRAEIQLRKEKQRVAEAKRRGDEEAQSKELADLAKRTPDVRSVCWGDSSRIVKLVEKLSFHEYENGLIGDVSLGKIKTLIRFSFHEDKLIQVNYSISQEQESYLGSELELLRKGLDAKYGEGKSSQMNVANFYSSSVDWRTTRSRITYTSSSLGATTSQKLCYSSDAFDWRSYEEAEKRKEEDAKRRRDQELKDKAKEKFKNDL